MSTQDPLKAIRMVRDFHLMHLASCALDQGLEKMEDLDQDMEVVNFCANGASMRLSVRDILAFLDGVRELDLRQRKITDALSAPQDLPHLDQPQPGPAG